jgi:hypothetical protein
LLIFLIIAIIPQIFHYLALIITSNLLFGLPSFFPCPRGELHATSFPAANRRANHPDIAVVTCNPMSCTAVFGCQTPDVLPKCAPMDVPSSFMVFRPASQKNMNAIALHQTGLRYSKLYFVPEFA